MDVYLLRLFLDEPDLRVGAAGPGLGDGGLDMAGLAEIGLAEVGLAGIGLDVPSQREIQ